jgi:hypothetical protein
MGGVSVSAKTYLYGYSSRGRGLMCYRMRKVWSELSFVHIIVYRGTEEPYFVFWGVGLLRLNLTNVRSPTPIFVSSKLD